MSGMDFTNQRKNQPLFWRAGFGPMAEDLNALASHTQKSFMEALWKAADRPVAYLGVADNALKGLAMGAADAASMQRKELPAEEKKQFRQQSQQAIRSLNLAWLQETLK